MTVAVQDTNFKTGRAAKVGLPLNDARLVITSPALGKHLGGERKKGAEEEQTRR